MTAENFHTILSRLQQRRPYQIFTVELQSGQRFEIDDPYSFIHREGKGVFVAPGGIPVWFDHESVSQIFEAPASTDFRSKESA
jgi:hypothetical protein